MIDLMEIGRRLWDGDDPLVPAQPPTQARQATDLLLPDSDASAVTGVGQVAPTESAGIRSSSAGVDPQPGGLSANPQNPQPTEPAPSYETEAIITALVSGAGRDLGMPLANRLRDVLAPMDRHARAILAAAIDDAFETAKDAKEAQQEVAKLLGVWIPKQPRRGSLAGRVDWIDWIADRCPLVPEDRRFICVRLRTLPPKARERAARRYVATWQEAAEAEPKDHCKTNRGRCAANRSLLALIR